MIKGYASLPSFVSRFPGVQVNILQLGFPAAQAFSDAVLNNGAEFATTSVMKGVCSASSKYSNDPEPPRPNDCACDNEVGFG